MSPASYRTAPPRVGEQNITGRGVTRQIGRLSGADQLPPLPVWLDTSAWASARWTSRSAFAVASAYAPRSPSLSALSAALKAVSARRSRSTTVAGWPPFDGFPVDGGGFSDGGVSGRLSMPSTSATAVATFLPMPLFWPSDTRTYWSTG